MPETGETKTLAHKGGPMAPLGGRIITKPFIILSAIAAIAGLLLIKRFAMGLGAVTNMSDGYPWGIWIAYDVVAGTALACGGYAIALLVYAMNKWEYHPLVRPALLTSLFGYTLAGVSIFFDIGRYWQAYNPILPQYAQLNSVMFEVALCVMSYIGVLWVEFAPAYLEGREGRRAGLNKSLKKVLFVFIALGMLLPTMHQSSLGSLLIIAGPKVNPLWQTNLLPLLFLISAIAMGYGAVVLESVLSSMGFKREMETPLLSKLSAYIPPLIGVYLIIRFGDLIARGKLSLIFGANLQSLMFLIENALYIASAVILASASNRSDGRKLFLASAFLLLAGGLYRFNAFLVGFDPGAGWSYFPSASEMMVTFGIISVEIMGYLYIVKKLPVLPSGRRA